MNTIPEIVMFIIIMLSVGLGIGMLAWRYKRNSLRDLFKDVAQEKPDREVEIARIRAQDRAEAREMYERVVREKLDVIKTAIATGYSAQELKQLDQRLEHLIGSDKLQALLDGREAPAPSGELLDADLSQELSAIKQAVQQRESS